VVGTSAGLFGTSDGIQLVKVQGGLDVERCVEVLQIVDAGVRMNRALRCAGDGLRRQREQRPELGTVCEHAVIPHEVLVRCREQRGEPFEELERLHDQLGHTGGGGPGPGELVMNPAVGENREAALREGRPKPIPAKPLKTFAVVLFDGTCSM
jgi:hypothetical protein